MVDPVRPHNQLSFNISHLPLIDHWPLINGQSLIIDNCKLIIEAAGGRD